jgi:hypothetical protein
LEPVIQGILRFVLAGVLLFAAVSKLASPRTSSAALESFGLRRPGARWAAWTAAVAAELVLAAGVAAGRDEAAYAASGLLVLYTLALTVTAMRGGLGRPCGCFGPRSRIGWHSIARTGILAIAMALLPVFPGGDLTTDQALAAGLVLALLACAGLTVALLALYREVGLLRLRLGPQAALEIPEEGPELGGASALIDRFEPGPDAELALAVFSSEGCHVCRGLAPAVSAVGNDPLIALREFDEVADAEVWRDADVPGSPFAVALDLSGTVLAKGTFNSLAQLESVIATAMRRRLAAVPGAHV